MSTHQNNFFSGSVKTNELRYWCCKNPWFQKYWSDGHTYNVGILLCLESLAFCKQGTMWNRWRSRQFATFWNSLIAGQILSNDSLLSYHSLDIFTHEFIFTTFVLAISMGGRHLLHPLVIFLWYVLEKIAQMYRTPIILLLGKDSRPWQAWWQDP